MHDVNQVLSHYYFEYPSLDPPLHPWHDDDDGGSLLSERLESASAQWPPDGDSDDNDDDDNDPPFFAALTTPSTMTHLLYPPQKEGCVTIINALP